MKNKHLKTEIKALLNNVENAFSKDSLQYKNLDYYFDILENVYQYKYDSDKDLLEELKALLLQLSMEMPELAYEQLQENYPNISKMIDCLDEWLTD